MTTAKKASLADLADLKQGSGAFYQNLGERIRQARLTTKLGLVAFSADMGISYQQLQKFEDGTNRISVDRLLQVVKLTGLPVSWFIKDIDRPPTKTRQRQAYTLLELMQLWEKLPTAMRSHLMAMVRKAVT